MMNVKSELKRETINSAVVLHSTPKLRGIEHNMVQLESAQPDQVTGVFEESDYDDARAKTNKPKPILF